MMMRTAKTTKKPGIYIRLFGVPAHIERSVKERSKYIDHLDFDIVNKRSWSLAAKVHEQRQRNYARSMEHYRDFNWYAAADRLQKISGFQMAVVKILSFNELREHGISSVAGRSTRSKRFGFFPRRVKISETPGRLARR